MKKILMLIIGFLILPTITNAVAYSESFAVGDDVRVLPVNDTDGVLFTVIKPSVADYQYVWLIYNGNVADNSGHSIVQYFEFSTPEDEPKTNIEAATIYQVLQQGTAAWRARTEEIRLLQIEDLTELGVQLSGGKYEIMANRDFLAPIITAPHLEGLVNKQSGYNYWTQSPDSSAANPSVYVIKYNESYQPGSLLPIAYAESVDISDDMTAPEFIVRPVIKIDKKYVDCNLSVTPEPAPNPPTGEINMPLQVVAVVALAGIGYVLVRKKEVFEKI